MRKRRSGLYYGHIIVAACFLIMTLAYGAQNTFGVFFKPMASEFGWTRAATSGPFALFMVVCGLLSIVSGKISDRFGPRIVVSTGAIVLGAGYLLMYTINHLWQLYLFYGVIVAAGTSAIYVPLVAMIARWFTKNRGAMSGIGIAGIGFGIGIMPPLASQMIEIWEWRLPWLILGGSVMVLIILLAGLLKREPDTEVAQDLSNGRTDHTTLRKGLTYREALKTRQFWMIFTAWIFYGFFFQIGVVHIVPFGTDQGMTAVSAATVLSIIGIIGTVGRVALGFIGDRLGNRNTVFISYGIMGASYIGLSFIHSPGMLYSFAVIFGFLFGIGILLIPMVAEYFGFRGLGLISGTIIFSNSLGGAIGPPVAGAIFDATGSYEIAFLACAVTGLAACIIIWLLKPVKEKDG